MSVIPSRLKSGVIENICCQQRTLHSGGHTNSTYLGYCNAMNSIILGQTTVSRKSNTDGKTADISAHISIILEMNYLHYLPQVYFSNLKTNIHKIAKTNICKEHIEKKMDMVKHNKLILLIVDYYHICSNFCYDSHIFVDSLYWYKTHKTGIYKKKYKNQRHIHANVNIRFMVNLDLQFELSFFTHSMYIFLYLE